MTDKQPHTILGEVIVAKRVLNAGWEPRQARNMIFLLAVCVAIMMTGLGIIYPVFARRLGELGGGVEILGWMTMAFAMAQLLMAPFLGTLADRYGRRPVILLSLAAFALANLGFLLARSTGAFIAVRALEGGLTAGLFPAAMGVVGDTVPEDQRGRWVGVVMGSYAAGFFIGPIFGGFLYDGWGYTAPFIFSAFLGAVALSAALILVPETRSAVERKRERLRNQWQAVMTERSGKETLWNSLPRPLYLFLTLLIVDFMLIFAFAFVEPQMVFYFYDQLNWTTMQFGLVVGAYGLTTVIGQSFLGRLGDRYGRKPLIVLGLFVNAIFYAGLAFITSFPVMLVGAMFAGLGEALAMPALSAFYLDITAEQHRSRIMGVKEAAAAMGGVLGPLLIVAISPITTPQGVFMIALALMFVTGILAALVLRNPSGFQMHATTPAVGYPLRQGLAAQAALRSLVARARTARESNFADMKRHR